MPPRSVSTVKGNHSKKEVEREREKAAKREREERRERERDNQANVQSFSQKNRT